MKGRPQPSLQWHVVTKYWSKCHPPKFTLETHFVFKFDVFRSIWWLNMINLDLNFLFASRFCWKYIPFSQKFRFHQLVMKKWPKCPTPFYTQMKIFRKFSSKRTSLLYQRLNNFGRPVYSTGVDLVKLFCRKFTHSFMKAISFCKAKNNGYINQTVQLTKTCEWVHAKKVLRDRP